MFRPGYGYGQSYISEIAFNIIARAGYGYGYGQRYIIAIVFNNCLTHRKVVVTCALFGGIVIAATALCDVFDPWVLWGRGQVGI